MKLKATALCGYAPLSALVGTVGDRVWRILEFDEVRSRSWESPCTCPALRWPRHAFIQDPNASATPTASACNLYPALSCLSYPISYPQVVHGCSLIFTEDLSQFTAPRSVPLQNAIEDLSSHGIEDIPDLIFGWVAKCGKGQEAIVTGAKLNWAGHMFTRAGRHTLLNSSALWDIMSM